MAVVVAAATSNAQDILGQAYRRGDRSCGDLLLVDVHLFGVAALNQGENTWIVRCRAERI